MPSAAPWGGRQLEREVREARTQPLDALRLLSLNSWAFVNPNAYAAASAACPPYHAYPSSVVPSCYLRKPPLSGRAA